MSNYNVRYLRNQSVGQNQQVHKLCFKCSKYLRHEVILGFSRNLHQKVLLVQPASLILK
jgi:hypothetical protein